MFDKKPKPPIAWVLNKLPSAKTLVELDQMIRPFPKDMLRKCAAKVAALQKKRQLLAERDVAIEVPGVGTDNDALAALFFGASSEQVIIPVNGNGNHWCTIMVDLGKEKRYFYYPTESSYKIGIRTAAHVVKKSGFQRGDLACTAFKAMGATGGSKPTVTNVEATFYLTLRCSVWITQIMVNAIGDYSAQPSPFVALEEREADEEEKEDNGAGPTSGSKSAPLDFTQDSTPPSTPRAPLPKQRKRPAGSRNRQLRPDPYTPSDKDALDPGNHSLGQLSRLVLPLRTMR
ncbi:unnamed protein product [Phytophthora fragariaefolia]|uniref:Unnamed protein product n=1 Tax=Phytophthora fragariaefolia TaxID=1490495 RepID=A0A9W6XU28_9STRA|nr:unnamed protein product [Phytophthora fragariaefolia]